MAVWSILTEGDDAQSVALAEEAGEVTGDQITRKDMSGSSTVNCKI